ncbi:hypothetical protein C0991_000493, partial [Blastosporella zonata]
MSTLASLSTFARMQIKQIQARKLDRADSGDIGAIGALFIGVEGAGVEKGEGGRQEPPPNPLTREETIESIQALEDSVRPTRLVAATATATATTTTPPLSASFEMEELKGYAKGFRRGSGKEREFTRVQGDASSPSFTGAGTSTLLTRHAMKLDAIHLRFRCFLQYKDVRTVVDLGAGEGGWSEFVRGKLAWNWKVRGSAAPAARGDGGKVWEAS